VYGESWESSPRSDGKYSYMIMLWNGKTVVF
jgi:hypothetical protein